MNQGKDDFILGYKDIEHVQPANNITTKNLPSRHTYILGQTGSGKTTMLRYLAKHNEMYNLQLQEDDDDGNGNGNEKERAAFIFVDTKGVDSKAFLRQCDKRTFDNGWVHYLNPDTARFSINPFQISGQYKTPEDKKRLIDRRVDEITGLIESWYGSQQSSFHRLSAAFQMIIKYMYTLDDNPTFYDMWTFVQKVKNNDEEFKKELFEKIYRPADDNTRNPDLRFALSDATIKDADFSPLLNRLEKFTFEPVLKQMFCVRESTIDIAEIIKPGRFTIFSISHETADHLVAMVQDILAFLIWQSVQRRTLEKSAGGDNNKVILALDEFAQMQGVSIINKMLELGHENDLSVILTHQTTGQIKDTKRYENILNNVVVQLIGAVSEADVARIADIWEPAGSKKITKQLASQRPHQWTAKIGESVEQFWGIKPNNDKGVSAEFVEQFIKAEDDKHGHGVVATSVSKSEK